MLQYLGGATRTISIRVALDHHAPQYDAQAPCIAFYKYMVASTPRWRPTHQPVSNASPFTDHQTALRNDPANYLSVGSRRGYGKLEKEVERTAARLSGARYDHGPVHCALWKRAFPRPY